MSSRQEIAEQIKTPTEQLCVPSDEWQPMSTAPKDGTKILILFGWTIVESHWLDYVEQWCTPRIDTFQVAHEPARRKALAWMPRPATPKWAKS